MAPCFCNKAFSTRLTSVAFVVYSSERRSGLSWSSHSRTYLGQGSAPPPCCQHATFACACAPPPRSAKYMYLQPNIDCPIKSLPLIGLGKGAAAQTFSLDWARKQIEGEGLNCYQHWLPNGATKGCVQFSDGQGHQSGARPSTALSELSRPWLFAGLRG